MTAHGGTVRVTAEGVHQLVDACHGLLCQAMLLEAIAERCSKAAPPADAWGYVNDGPIS